MEEVPKGIKLGPQPNIFDALALHELGSNQSSLPPVPVLDGMPIEVKDTRHVALPQHERSSSIYTIYTTRNPDGSVEIMLNQTQLMADFTGPIDGMLISRDGSVTQSTLFMEPRNPQTLWNFIQSKVAQMEDLAPETSNVSKEPGKVIQLAEWASRRA